MIKIEQLGKSYSKNQVLKHISLDFNKVGNLTAILGPNGSGKTTLIKSILGMVIPEEGQIFVQEKNIKHRWDYRSAIGYLPQIARFPENLTFDELISMVQDLRGPAVMAEELIDLFELQPFRKYRLQNLSGGTKQKLNLILALMYDSPILILDEPTTGLDPLSLIRLKEIVLREKSKKKLMLVSTHILSFVEEMADDIVFLLEGKVYFHGSIEKIKKIQQETNLERAIANILRNQKEPEEKMPYHEPRSSRFKFPSLQN